MEIVARRLGQYGATWFAAFLLTLVLALGARLALGMDLIALSDMLLLVGFLVLTLLTVAGVVTAFIRPGPVGPKLLVLMLAVVLYLPLLWAPVLAIVLAAFFVGVPIEYSGVYAQFRIIVSELLYPVVSAVVSGAAIRFVWEVFQIFATIVGAIASAIQVWNFFRKLFAAPERSYAAAPPPEDAPPVPPAAI